MFLFYPVFAAYTVKLFSLLRKAVKATTQCEDASTFTEWILVVNLMASPGGSHVTLNLIVKCSTVSLLTQEFGLWSKDFPTLVFCRGSPGCVDAAGTPTKPDEAHGLRTLPFYQKSIYLFLLMKVHPESSASMEQ